MFCPVLRKLQAFGILKWAQGSQWRKQRTSNSTHEIQADHAFCLGIVTSYKIIQTSEALEGGYKLALISCMQALLNELFVFDMCLKIQTLNAFRF